MKKVLYLTLAVLLCVACSRVQSSSGGMESMARISFVAPDNDDITVIIDGKSYKMEAVEQKDYDRHRPSVNNNNTVTISIGQHDVQVVKEGKTIYQQKVFVSTGQHKYIQL